VDKSACELYAGNTTNATPSNITTDATPPTTEQTPPAENGSGDDYGNQPPPTGDVPPSSVRKLRTCHH